MACITLISIKINSLSINAYQRTPTFAYSEISNDLYYFPIQIFSSQIEKRKTHIIDCIRCSLFSKLRGDHTFAMLIGQ